jgi:uncharacterized membrane protein HdeD (DUF308 family)
MKQRLNIQDIEAAQAILAGQGVLAIMFGLAAIFWPGLTSLALAYLFAVFLLIDGFALLILGFGKWTRRARTRIWWGLLQVLLGLFVLYNPDITFGVLVLILGMTLIVRGAFNAAHAILWSHERFGERLMHSVQGGLGLAVGTVVILQPAAGGLAFVWILGLYALVTGTMLLALAFGAGKPRNHHGLHGKHHAA